MIYWSTSIERGFRGSELGIQLGTAKHLLGFRAENHIEKNANHITC